MALIYGGHKKLDKMIAKQHIEVGEALDFYTLEIATRAEGLLEHHRQTGTAAIDVERGKVDNYVILEDTNVTNADRSITDDEGNVTGYTNSALSIEYGRKDRKVKDADGNERIIKGMEGLYILHRAAGIKAKNKGSRTLK